MPEQENIFTWLDHLRERPGMYLGSGGLDVLETLVHGYCTALDLHQIDEGVPDMLHFGDWLRHRTDWSTSCGWARAITDNAGVRPPLDVFFEWTREYRSLAARLVCFVVTTEANAPTGRRVVIGHAGRMQRPDRVDILQYHPEPLFFLRFHFRNQVQTQRILFDNGTNATSKEFAMRWVEDELAVARTAWREPPN